MFEMAYSRRAINTRVLFDVLDAIQNVRARVHAAKSKSLAASSTHGISGAVSGRTRADQGLYVRPQLRQRGNNESREVLTVGCRFMSIVKASLSFLFACCRHSSLSRVFTLRGRSYRVCYSCGAEFEYSLEFLRLPK